MIRTLLTIGGGAALLVLITLLRLAIRRESFRCSELADLNRGDVDPSWPRARAELPPRRPRRIPDIPSRGDHA